MGSGINLIDSDGVHNKYSPEIHENNNKISQNALINNNLQYNLNDPMNVISIKIMYLLISESQLREITLKVTYSDTNRFSPRNSLKNTLS